MTINNYWCQLWKPVVEASVNQGKKLNTRSKIAYGIGIVKFSWVLENWGLK